MEDWNDRARKAWNENAAWWDESMGEEDEFHRHLIHPAVIELLQPRRGQTVLEVGCGNGNLARLLAKMGVDVVAFDFSERLIERAKAKTTVGGRIEYGVLDATSERELDTLADEFDVVVASMVLHDMAEIQPLLQAVVRCLKHTAGWFVWAVPHPCFNTPKAIYSHDRSFGKVWSLTYGVRITEYLNSCAEEACVKQGQPTPQPVFHRPLSLLFGECFRAGLVLNGLLEPSPSTELREEEPDTWEQAAQIPPILVTRWVLKDPTGS